MQYGVDHIRIDGSVPTDKREALARVLSIIYYGERAAVIVASQLCADVPDEEAKMALAAQVMEEAKRAPRITESYLAELARKRDQYFAYLAR